MVVSPPSCMDYCQRPTFVRQIPGYAVYKLWGSVISPLLLGRSSSPAAQDDAGKKESLSKRQEKLRKRSERGDPRVQVRQR